MLPSNLPHPFALLYQRRKALKHFRFRGQSYRQTYSTKPFNFCRLTTSSIILPRQRIGIPWSAKNLKYKYSTRINFSDKLHRKALKPRLSPSFQPVILLIANIKKYIGRLLAFALITEIPFNLMTGGGWLYPYHQNVLWTFLIAIICMIGIDKTKRSNRNIAVKIILIILIVFLGWIIGTITFVDYYGFGVLTVLTFYAFHQKNGGII